MNNYSFFLAARGRAPRAEFAVNAQFQQNFPRLFGDFTILYFS
jgi:hypothetical protein